MPEIDGFKTILPLPPPPHQLTREAQAMMDGYEPMTGRVGIEITYLVIDDKSIEYTASQIIADLAGIVFDGPPEVDQIKVHVLAEGYVNPSVIIDVWQEGINND